MKLIKKVEHIDSSLYAPLETLLTKLYHKLPSLTFESCRVGYIRGEDKAICDVKVFNGNEYVGTIEVEYTSFRNQGKCDVYTIESPRIKNRIYPRHAKLTKLPEEALKTAVKVFGQTSTSAEIIAEMKQRMSSEVGGIQYNAVRNAEKFGDDHVIPLMQVALAVKDGRTPVISPELMTALSKPNIDKLMNTARIALSVNADYKKASGIVVREERDGTLLGIVLDASQLPDDMRVLRFKDTYEMPELYQTKLAMLRMLEHNQPVESIGIKFAIDNINWYYLTGGEIITTS